jgi:hypothetical protein
MKNLLLTIALIIGLSSTAHAANPPDYNASLDIASLRAELKAMASSTSSDVWATILGELIIIKHYPIISATMGLALGSVAYNSLTQIENQLLTYNPEVVEQYTPAQRKVFKVLIVALYGSMGAWLGSKMAFNWYFQRAGLV